MNKLATIIGIFTILVIILAGASGLGLFVQWLMFLIPTLILSQMMVGVSVFLAVIVYLIIIGIIAEYLDEKEKS